MPTGVVATNIMAMKFNIYQTIWTWTCFYLLMVYSRALCQESSTHLPSHSQPKIIEVRTKDCVMVNEETPCISAEKPHNVTFVIEGALEHKHIILGLTTDNETCSFEKLVKKYPLNYMGMPEMEDITLAIYLNDTQTAYEMDYYSCISNDNKTWVHQGPKAIRARR